MAVDESAAAALLEPRLDPVQDIDASPLTTQRRTVAQVYLFSALFWSAMFVMHTVNMMLANDREDVRTISWRAGMNVLAFLFCLPIGAVIRRTLDRSFGRRLVAILAAALPIAVLYAVIGHIVWMEILKVGSMSYSPAVGIAIQSHYYLVLFLLWSSFATAILFAARLQERERSLLAAQALAHQAELKMLRYQINPHFLFNTLNAVSALIVTGQTNAAEAMVGKLARFFRTALSRESTAKVTLAEDIRVQLEYLSIELTRFPDRLRWSTQIDPDVEPALVPHLILQPLFENAIKHGVARSAGPVEIRISARRAKDRLHIVVENDVRVGMTPGVSDGAGVGLANVARRLHSFYGAEGRLESQQRDGKFTVSLHLPLEFNL